MAEHRQRHEAGQCHDERLSTIALGKVDDTIQNNLAGLL
jgi:hypothetical protein